MQTRAGVSIRYVVKTKAEAWVIPEGPVPESTAHDAAVLRLFLLLRAWASSRPSTRVARNLALRWLEQHPKVGIDPDVCLLEPAPADFDSLSSLRLWEPNRVCPTFCAEIVSRSHPYKDYAEIHERYAALGAFELFIFDPMLYGPRSLGGPVALQLWRRDALGALERVHFENEPVYSQALDAWLSVERQELVISDDRNATRRWQTGEERERSEKERERSEKERERSEKERERSEKEREQAARAALEQRVVELERARDFKPG